MKGKFSEYIQRMPILLNELKGKPLLNRNELKDIPRQGVYVFYESRKALYAGRSNRMKERIQEHSRQSSDNYSATFALRLAKEEYGRNHVILKSVTNKDLLNISQFKSLFSKAKERVAGMEIRVLKSQDQVEQTLLEIYAALALNTRYNDFGTH